MVAILSIRHSCLDIYESTPPPIPLTGILPNPPLIAQGLSPNSRGWVAAWVDMYFTQSTPPCHMSLKLLEICTPNQIS